MQRRLRSNGRKAVSRPERAKGNRKCFKKESKQKRHGNRSKHHKKVDSRRTRFRYKFPASNTEEATTNEDEPDSDNSSKKTSYSTTSDSTTRSKKKRREQVKNKKAKEMQPARCIMNTTKGETQEELAISNAESTNKTVDHFEDTNVNARSSLALAIRASGGHSRHQQRRLTKGEVMMSIRWKCTPSKKVPTNKSTKKTPRTIPQMKQTIALTNERPTNPPQESIHR